MKKQFFLFRPSAVFNACKKALQKCNGKITMIDEESFSIQAMLCQSIISDKLNLEIRVIAHGPESCCVEIKSTVERKGMVKTRKAIEWELQYLDMLFMVITGTPSYYQAFDKSENFLKYVELSRKQKESTFETRNVIWHMLR